MRKRADATTRPPLPTMDCSALAGLLEKVASADSAAFGELYTAAKPAVFHAALAVLRDTSQAEEVTQEVFAEIWRTATRFDPAKGTATSWIRRLAHSRAVDRVRHARAMQVLDHRYHHRHLPREDDTVVEQVLRNADAAHVLRALATLTTLQRQALQLTYLQEHTNEQASNLLGIPLPTLKSRVLSALKSLRRTQPD